MISALSLLALVFLLIPQPGFAVTAVDANQVNLSVTCPDEICLFRGCTDSQATNYNSAAGYDDGSCTYPPVVTHDILGCRDSAAVNYNPNATVDNGSCRYAVPNVSNFTATGVGAANVRLAWTKPVFSQFQSVVIVKKAGVIPTGLLDGEIIYDGSGSAVVDYDLAVGTRYYYLAIVKSTTGGISSGALTSYRLAPAEPPWPPVRPPAIGPGVPGGSGGSGGIYSPPGPFGELPVGPVATGTQARLAQIPQLFVLKQPGERPKPFFDGSYVKIKGNKPITVSADYYKLPEALKTIGMTLYRIDDPSRSFSFLLKLNDKKTAYEATIGPLPEDGVYGASIYLINYQDQTIKKFNGQIAVVGSLGILGAGPEKFIRQVAGPVAVTGGALAGLLELLFASSGAAGGTLAEIYLLFLRQLGAVLGYLGFKKKNKPWGTVYDSVTKRPIDPAYVTVLAGGEEVATAITDIDGRYGFSLLDGQYTLKAAKTHYRFPSVLLSGWREDIMYTNLYFGEPFQAGAGEVVSKNIPLDPVGFDWNEFVKGQGRFSALFKKRELLRVKIARYIYNIGFIASLFYLVFRPSIFNILVPLLYSVIWFGQRYYRRRHKVVMVKNAMTGEPLSFAVVRVFYAELGQEVKKVVTDMIGRFYLLVRPGTYYLAIDHKQPDGTYARIHQTAPAELPKGIWENDIMV